MNSRQKFNFKLADRFLENYAEPPEDPLEELSHFEMGWRRFCFEFDHKVLIEIGDEKIDAFLDLDISMMIQSNIMSGRSTMIKLLPPATNRNESNH
jgi:hypothetical protein